MCIKDTKASAFYEFRRNTYYYGYFLKDDKLGDSISMHTHNSYKEGCSLKFSIEKEHYLFKCLHEYFIDVSPEARKEKLKKLNG